MGIDPMFEFLGYLTVIGLICYTIWGWKEFDNLSEFEQKWKLPWVALMVAVIGGLLAFWSFV